MRFYLAVLLGSASAFGFADRVLNVPIAGSIGKNRIRLESVHGLNNRNAREQFFEFSPINSLDFTVRNRNRLDDDGSLTTDISYTVVPPVRSFAPGIAVGVLDAANKTFDGRRGFVAFTFRELLEVGTQGETGDLTIGAQFGSINSGLFAVTLPFSGHLRFIAEHNGARLTTGFETNPINGLNLRILNQDKLLLGGIQYTVRF
jgi:hypothetical protein